MKSTEWRWLPLLLWMLLIFVESSRPAPSAPGGLRADLLAIGAHLLLFGITAFLVLLGRRALARPRVIDGVVAILVATLYGVSDEVHQSFVPQRRADVMDVITDLIGAVVVVAMVFAVAHWRSNLSARTHP